ncbi:hypothetical protein DL96DRAFT_1813086 [Flagelloscypha sp. PMI_526]|nr:hypothetical protein DL96DRAFT_1813086 [Flagelloscypha sp. PMI_526]
MVEKVQYVPGTIKMYLQQWRWDLGYPTDDQITVTLWDSTGNVIGYAQNIEINPDNGIYDMTSQLPWGNTGIHGAATPRIGTHLKVLSQGIGK